MIVAPTSDPVLRLALLRAGRPGEDVFVDAASCAQALAQGFPRVVLMVHDQAQAIEGLVGRLEPPVPTLVVDSPMLRAWELERRQRPVPPPRVEHATARLRLLLSTLPREGVWVDRALRDLQRASGARLPAPLRGFARRVMESPARYGDLHGIARVAGVTRGALKARFRRRCLASPYAYLRWFRVMAAGHVLSDPTVTTLRAAERLGFASGGNLCRMIQAVAGLTPTELRTPRSWHRVLTSFALRYLDAESLAAWEDMDGLFLRAA